MEKTIILSALLLFSCAMGEQIKNDLYQILVLIDKEAVETRDGRLVESAFSISDYSVINIKDSIDSIQQRILRIEKTMDVSYVVMPYIVDDFDKSYASAHGQQNIPYFRKFCNKFFGADYTTCFDWPIQFTHTQEEIKTSCVYFGPRYLKAAVLVLFESEYCLYFLQKQSDKWGIRYKFTLDNRYN